MGVREDASAQRGWVVAAAVTIGLAAAVAAAGEAHAQEGREDVRPGSLGRLAEARRLSDAFAEVVERVSPSVVSIRTVTVGGARGPLLRAPIRRGTGSGFLFDREGHILTNRHVVAGARQVQVTLQDGRTLDANVVGDDRALDVAVLQVTGPRLLPAPLGSSEDARVGELVLAIGSPFGLDQTVTAGVLSAKGRHGIGLGQIGDFLQTDAAINPGNSGGPLVNLAGEVIGINSMIVGRGSGLGFAIPIELAHDSARQLIETGRVERAWLGVGVDDLVPAVAERMGAPEGARAVIASIDPGSAAERAGIEVSDIVVSIDGEPVPNSRHLVREILGHRVGERITLVVVRGGRTLEVAVVLGTRPPLGR